MLDAEPSPGQNKFASALGGVLLGGVVAAMGVLFTFALWVGFGRAKETRGWTETPCEITKSELAAERPTPNSPVAYRAVVEYSYEFAGAERTGKSVKRVDGPSSHRSRAEQVVADFPLGTRTNCWVNPADPAQAVLEHSTLAPLYSIWFPGLFVVAGLGIAASSLWRALR